ncbi:DUF3617 domain-containing protein [Sphingomonas sp.]|uniref:DUF3617 domain-containing protein n=1 Tax=Sphingomonas sp. TaxID=28214 RepID=UPI003B3B6A6F
MLRAAMALSALLLCTAATKAPPSKSFWALATDIETLAVNGVPLDKPSVTQKDTMLCVASFTPADLRRLAIGDPRKECAIDRFKAGGGRIAFTARCPANAHRDALTADVSGSYDDEKLRIVSAMHVTSDGSDIVMRMTVRGNRMAACLY